MCTHFWPWQCNISLEELCYFTAKSFQIKSFQILYDNFMTKRVKTLCPHKVLTFYKETKRQPSVKHFISLHIEI